LPDSRKFCKNLKYSVKIIYGEKLEWNINRNGSKFSTAIQFSKTATFLESSRDHGCLGILSMEREVPY
jgi:hypothetical protein